MLKGEELPVDLLTVEETAKLLKVSQITIRRYISSGRLPAVRIGRGVRIERDSIEDLLTPIEPRIATPRSRVPKGQPFTMEDPLWNIVGIGRTDPPTNVAEHKDEYVADAIDSRQA